MRSFRPSQPPDRRSRGAALRALRLLVLIAGLTLAPRAVHAADQAVGIGDGAFSASTVTVAVGDTVTWTNTDDSPHTVTAADGAFDSGNMEAGQVFSFTFSEPGTYRYVCAYHSEMTATVVVEAAAPAEGDATPATTAAAADNSPAPAMSHAAAVAQPDTALPTQGGTALPIAPLLIGLGLLILGIGLVPMRASAQPVREHADLR